MRFFWVLPLLLMICHQTRATEDGSQHTALTQINPRNVDELSLAFEFHSGDLGMDFRHKGHSFQATPVFWDGRLYVSTSSNSVIALDAGSGEELWRFDPNLDRSIHYSESASRGVAIWHGGDESCAHRIFHGTLHGRLYALDALTGKRCEDFGDRGEIDLGVGIRNRRVGEYSVTSPVAVLSDRIIVGSSIGDNGAVDLEQGIVRALDPRSGELLWQWDPIPKRAEDLAMATWGGASHLVTGAANAWAPLSVDTARRLVFVPTSSPSPDFYGGERLGENLYANSLVAINVDTGEVAWHQQLVHHDVWDYDLPAEPSLTVIRRGGREIDAVVMVTKTGMLFAFDRDNGAPLYRMTEKAVPQSDVPGEQTNATQPFSEITLVPHDPVTVEDAFGFGSYRDDCENIIRESRSEGLFTPPSLQGSIMYPSWAGGVNWGGVALDEGRQIAVLNSMNLPGIIKLLPREEFNRAVSEQSMPGWQLTAMAGTPYGMARRIFLSGLGMPCLKPPWGHLAAVDLESGKILWQQPFGTIEDLSPVPIPGWFARRVFSDWGAPNHGGPMTTASGLTFIGASLDFYLRAFATETGEELWRYRLPTSANAIPVSYEHEGRQYIAIAVGGHSGAGTRRGDSVMVFSLDD